MSRLSDFDKKKVADEFESIKNGKFTEKDRVVVFPLPSKWVFLFPVSGYFLQFLPGYWRYNYFLWRHLIPAVMP